MHRLSHAGDAVGRLCPIHVHILYRGSDLFQLVGLCSNIGGRLIVPASRTNHNSVFIYEFRAGRLRFLPGQNDLELRFICCHNAIVPSNVVIQNIICCSW